MAGSSILTGLEVEVVGKENEMRVRSRLKMDRTFGILVIVPTVIAAIYFSFFASDVYISESKFVVRDPTRQPNVGLSLLLNAPRFSGFGDQGGTVREFIGSRDSLAAINSDGFVSRAFSRPGVSPFDRFGGLWGGATNEHLYRYFAGMAKAESDTNTAIATLTVRAFSPLEAQTINRRLLEQSELLVNRLSERGRQDLVGFAESEVKEAEERAAKAARQLALYRNRAGVVDPERQATIQLQMIAKLQDELIASKTQLAQLRSFAPSNPQIPVLVRQIDELSRSIQGETASVAGGSKSLAGAAADYQRVLLESQVADKQLAGSIAALQDARNEARRKQSYIERIAQPSLPDYPLEPRRLRGVLATLVLGLMAWGILKLLTAGIREHLS